MQMKGIVLCTDASPMNVLALSWFLIDAARFWNEVVFSLHDQVLGRRSAVSGIRPARVCVQTATPPLIIQHYTPNVDGIELASKSLTYPFLNFINPASDCCVLSVIKFHALFNVCLEFGHKIGRVLVNEEATNNLSDDDQACANGKLQTKGM